MCLVYFDMKTEFHTKDAMREAGEFLAKVVLQELFQDLSFRPLVILGMPNRDLIDYAIAFRDTIGPEFEAYIAYTIDQGVSAEEAKTSLRDFNAIYSNGDTALLVDGTKFEEDLKKAASDDFFVFSPVMWTVDRNYQVQRYLELGARMILANEVHSVKNEVRNNGFEIATRDDIKGFKHISQTTKINMSEEDEFEHTHLNRKLTELLPFLNL